MLEFKDVYNILVREIQLHLYRNFQIENTEIELQIRIPSEENQTIKKIIKILKSNKEFV